MPRSSPGAKLAWAGLARRLQRRWYAERPAPLVLLPLAGAFGVLTALRRVAFGRGWLRSHRLPVPVVVVGNITVGGTGKTPLVIWLARWLIAQGRRPGILTRGYGGHGEVAQVPPDGDPARCGDEPLLLARRTGVPVFTGRDRVAAGRALLAAHPATDMLLTDDGLQHLRLARDLEIVVLDTARGQGNGALLPAGPLREGPWRLETVGALVLNGEAAISPAAGGIPRFRMRLEGSTFLHLRDPGKRAAPGALAGPDLHAVAGIGNPERFFAHLSALGLRFTAHSFPDHHRFTAADLDFGQSARLVMTEKDAIKCGRFAADNWWYLPVQAQVDDGLGEWVLRSTKRT